MGRPHVLAMPYPAQGHVIPLMEVAHCLAENGIRVTFVNTDYNHERIVKAMAMTERVTNAMAKTGEASKLIRLVSLPDGLEPGADRNDLGKLQERMSVFMPEKFEALVNEMNGSENEKVDCVVTEYGLGWALAVAKKLGIKRAAFLPAPVALLAQSLSVHRLIDEGIMDSNGTPLTQQPFKLSPDMPEMNPAHLTWACIGDLETQIKIFKAVTLVKEVAKLADRQICNSSYELEPGALALVSDSLPIGPLLASNRLTKSSAGHFWPQDSDCLAWLDQQPANSVIYIAFGSFTIFDKTQFQELALGLELTNRPFLWVVRQDITENAEKAYPSGIEERVKNRSKIVSWAPQQKVLPHPSIACFLTHCGWNSTIEGISNGIPFLCWPYFADQFLNRSYISQSWKIGVELDKDENGIISKEEIKHKVDHLLGDNGYKTRVVELQAKTLSSVATGGSSHENFSKFVEWIKES